MLSFPPLLFFALKQSEEDSTTHGWVHGRGRMSQEQMDC
jgi:hypothetical protein